MGNLIYSQDFITVADASITARTSVAGYNKLDVMDYWHLKARHRSSDLTKSDINPLFIFDMGSAQTVTSIYLSDINYDKVRILGHAASLAADWTAATFSSGDIAVSQNAWTGRYQVYIPLTAFNFRYLAVATPAAASAVGSYTTTWETGLVCIMDSVTTFTQNVAYPFRQMTEQSFIDIGRTGRMSIGDTIGWVGEITFGARNKSDELELKTFGRVDKSQPFLFYVNYDDTSEAYICLMDHGYSSEWFSYNAVQGAQSMRLREIISA